MVANERARRYTADEKRAATARAMEVGAKVAGDELGIPGGTLSCWVFKARQASQAAPADRSEAGAPSSSPAPGAAPSMPPKQPPKPLPVPPVPALLPSTPPVTAPRRTARPRAAKLYTPSQIAQALERVAAIGVKPAAKELGISRNALREWERKAAKAAKGEGPAPTSGPDPKTIEERRDAAILGEWRKQQGLGPSQVRNQLRRAGVKVSVHTVRRVMEEAGYRPPKVERRDHSGSYEALRPNQLWHMDFLHRYIHGQKAFVLALIDDHSRFVTGWALDDAERADAVIGAFEGAVARHGRPEAVMSDGGSAFWSWRAPAASPASSRSTASIRSSPPPRSSMEKARCSTLISRRSSSIG